MLNGLGEKPCQMSPGTLASGMLSLMIFIATRSSRSAQMTPTTPLQAKGCWVAGSFGMVLDLRKSPVRSAAVGTMALFMNVCVVWRRPE